MPLVPSEPCSIRMFLLSDGCLFHNHEAVRGSRNLGVSTDFCGVAWREKGDRFWERDSSTQRPGVSPLKYTPWWVLVLQSKRFVCVKKLLEICVAPKETHLRNVTSLVQDEWIWWIWKQKNQHHRTGINISAQYSLHKCSKSFREERMTSIWRRVYGL